MAPIIILNFEIEAGNYDVNVTPDKREIFIKNESVIVSELKENLSKFFDGVQAGKIDNGTNPN
jgi:DNA mismatch repair protein PMS2